LDIVYLASEEADALLFAERHQAKRLAQSWRSLTQSATWGDFKESVPEPEWEFVASIFEDYDEPLPPDDTAFDPEQVPGYSDGDFPLLWPPNDAVEWFPRDLIDKYGGAIEVTSNGYHLDLPLESAENIAADLRERGHIVEESTDDLPAFVAMAFVNKAEAIAG
jgi:hypothetical protein